MAGIPQIDPKTPYSDWGGAVLSRLRVVHWYLRQDDPNAPPRLYRSRPVMGSKGVSNATVTAYGDFLDETTVSGGVVGQEMGAGPIQSLQIRYVLDANNTNQFSQFQMVNHISPLGTADVSNSTIPQAVSMLREVRVQVVSLSSQPDLATDLKQLQIGFTTPSFEGTSATAGPAGGSGGGSGGGSAGGSGGGGGATIPTDPYPRRAFSVRVTPRALQGARL
jgi:uncharacterized membrane protein YgcG